MCVVIDRFYLMIKFFIFLFDVDESFFIFVKVLFVMFMG